MRSQGDYGRFWFTFLCRGATATELGEIRKRKAGATSYDSGDPDLWNCRRSASKKRTTITPRARTTNRKRYLSRPNSKNANTYKKKHDLAGSYFSYLS